MTATGQDRWESEQILDGGLTLRTARPDDVEAIVALQVQAFGEADEPLVRACLTGPGHEPSDWSVVVDGDRPVAACTLLSRRMVLDGVGFDAGQIEYVATAPAYQRRGLVRALFGRHHARSAALGHVAQFVAGIPYFYRRFGYGYGVSYPDLFVFDRARLHPTPGVTLRVATETDIPALVDLDRTRPTEGLRVQRGEDDWRVWIRAHGHDRPLRDGGERFFVAEQGGRVVGWSALAVEDAKRVLLYPAVATDAGVTDAIIVHALDQAGDELAVIGHDAPGTTFGSRVATVGTSQPAGLGIYVRIADPVAFLREIRPALSARLAASSFATTSGEVSISLYHAGLAISYDAGAVTGIRAIPGIEDPFDDFECGVAPDWFPALALGRWGAKELDRRVDDVSLGRHADLLEVLFPACDTDIAADL